MKVWILMVDDGFDYEPNVRVFGVYNNNVEALTVKNDEEIENPDAIFWVEEWKVE